MCFGRSFASVFLEAGLKFRWLGGEGDHSTSRDEQAPYLKVPRIPVCPVADEMLQGHLRHLILRAYRALRFRLRNRKAFGNSYGRGVFVYPRRLSSRGWGRP